MLATSVSLVLKRDVPAKLGAQVALITSRGEKRSKIYLSVFIHILNAFISSITD